jgi:hypothetical protein
MSTVIQKRSMALFNLRTLTDFTHCLKLIALVASEVIQIQANLILQLNNKCIHCAIFILLVFGTVSSQEEEDFSIPKTVATTADEFILLNSFVSLPSIVDLFPYLPTTSMVSAEARVTSDARITDKVRRPVLARLLVLHNSNGKMLRFSSHSGRTTFSTTIHCSPSWINNKYISSCNSIAFTTTTIPTNHTSTVPLDHVVTLGALSLSCCKLLPRRNIQNGNVKGRRKGSRW